MKKLHLIIGKLYKIKYLTKFKPIFNVVDSIFVGVKDTTDSAPHVVDNLDTKRYMTAVIVALMPATLASIYFFGWKALAIIFVSYVAGGLAEVTFAIIRKKEIHEGFLVTGLIFALVLPPTTPLWVVAVGVIFGTVFGKEMFGGTGRNIFNPALVGRLFITLAFPSIMTTSWLKPFTDAVTSATPLTTFKSMQVITPFSNLLLGDCTGSMGEIFRLGIIVGGLFLILTKVSNWRIPVSYLGTVFILSWLGNTFLGVKVAPPLFQLFAGGLLFGAMFMATDPVSSPFTKSGKWIFGIGCGIFTFLIRNFSGYVEGVMFSILLMNAFSPLIDHSVIELKYKPVKK